MKPSNMTLSKQFGELLVKSATQAGRSELAEELCASSVASDAGRTLAMVKACGREGNLKGAVAAFQRLRESGAVLGARAHNSLLEACVRCRDNAQALDLFAAMRRDGSADVVSFNIAIKLFLSLGRLEEARKLLQEMPAHGLQANAVTYNELVHAKVGKGDVRGALAIVGEMQKVGVSPNSVTCSILLKSIPRSSAAADADQIMALLDNIDGKMDDVLFSSVVEACIR